MKYTEFPTCYRELRASGKRAVERHINGDWTLPRIRQDGRENILWWIAECKKRRKAVPPEILKQIAKERSA